MTSPAAAFDRRNALTYLSLLFGVAALAAAEGGHSDVTGIAIALAVLADTFDGRFARRFGNDARRRALGVELDSLSDAIAFGIAPPLCAVMLLHADGAIGAALWIAAVAHAASAITRLASFNVGALDDASGPPRPGGFIGLPVPVAALIWSTGLLLHPSAAATTILLAITAAAMVSPLRVPRPSGAGLLLFACWPLAVAIAHGVGAGT
jgi:CDP-diacylglycerol---serine O-phosphatidyltransferase